MFRAELPLAVPLMMTGIRTAAVQVVATATLAALVGGGSWARIISPASASRTTAWSSPERCSWLPWPCSPRSLLAVVARLVTPGPAAAAVPRDGPAGGRARRRRLEAAPLPVARWHPALRAFDNRTAHSRRPGIAFAGAERVGCALRESSRQTRVAPRLGARDTEGGHPCHARPSRHPLRPRARSLTTACGESGSSGTRRWRRAASASGDACAPIAGDELVVLEDDKDLQTVDNIIPAVATAVAEANPALHRDAERGLGGAHHRGPGRDERRRRQRAAEPVDVAAACVEEAGSPTGV